MGWILSCFIAIGMAATCVACTDGSMPTRHKTAEASDAGVWAINRDLASPDASAVTDQDVAASDTAHASSAVVVARVASGAGSARP